MSGPNKAHEYYWDLRWQQSIRT